MHYVDNGQLSGHNSNHDYRVSEGTRSSSGVLIGLIVIGIIIALLLFGQRLFGNQRDAEPLPTNAVPVKE